MNVGQAAKMEYTEFCTMLRGFLSSDSDIRKNAEKTFNKLKAESPDQTLLLILMIVEGSEDEELRLQALVLTRNIFRGRIDGTDSLWMKITPEIKDKIKTTLLLSLEKETDKLARNNACDTISDLALELIPLNEWSGLDEHLFKLIDTNSLIHQQCALRILADLAPVISTKLSQHAEGVARVVQMCLQSSDMQVRVECLGFMTRIVEDGNKKVYKHLTGVLPNVVQSISQMLQLAQSSGDYDTLNKAMRWMIELADVPRGLGVSFMKPHLPQIVDMLTEIALINIETKTDDEEIDVAQNAAVEVLLGIAEGRPKMAVKSVNDFVNRVVDVLMKFMLDVRREKYAEWIDTGEDEDETEQRFYDVGEEGLDRLAHAMYLEESANFMPKIFQFVSIYLQKSEWHFKFVAIITLSQTVEYLDSKESESQMREIMQMLLTQLSNEDHRVRFAACQAIGQVALDHQPFVQERYYSEVLPSLINAMSDSHPRVQSHASAAFINFAEEVEKPYILPYADLVMEKLLSRINMSTPRMVREHAVTAVAVIAGVIEEHFLKYYETVMPLMMEIIQTCTGKDDRACRGKAIECISIIGMSVGQERFLEDGKVAMQVLLQIAATKLDDDDPVKEYLQEALGRFCRIFDKNFLPYLPHIVPSLLAILSQTPKDVSKEMENDEEDDDMTYVMLASGQSVGLKTSLIEDQERALDLLSIFIEVMGEQYEELIPSTVTALMPMLNHILSNEASQKALDTMACLIDAGRQILEAKGGDRNALSNMLTGTAEAVFKNLDDENFSALDSMVAEASGLNECIRRAGPNLLDHGVVGAMTEKVFSLLEKSSNRRIEIAARRHENDVDEEEMDEINSEEEQEQQLRSSLLEILGALMKHHPQEYIQSSSQATLTFIDTFLKDSSNPDDQAIALYVCDDMLEHLKEHSIPMWGVFLERLLSCINCPKPQVSQAASFGIAQAAKIANFSQYADTASQQLMIFVNKVQNNERAKSEMLSAADNAIAALGDLLKYHGDKLTHKEQCLDTWLKYLPLKDDDQEGRRVHADLMELVEQNNPSILGQNNENLTTLINIFCLIYKTDFSDNDLNDKIRIFFTRLIENGMDLQKLKAQMTQKPQKRIELILFDIQHKKETESCNASAALSNHSGELNKNINVNNSFNAVAGPSPFNNVGNTNHQVPE